MKRSVLRQAAEQDIDIGFTQYLDRAGSNVAVRFIESIDTAIRHIEQHRGSGSPRYGELFGTPDLRDWLLTGYPYVLFYVERDDHVDVIRLLHQHSDIPVQLQNNL